ncbi:high-potential iron-sulfur protein [Haloplanus halobius]|uniref:high-potential iron-sulfur protein n=1 Tax=Haloplanus halobius TaxID=2934938 RepID=UPI00200FD417|nr:high-potential iron-sulfur protein [Haloplanus sp. XH21]
MSDKLAETERRRLLALVGSGLATGLAGCGGGGGGATATSTATATATPTASDGGVPAAYETATSLDGTQRDPDALSSKDAVNYQAEPSDGQQCSDCRFYIEDKNGDGMGACAIVAGTIDPEGYCVSYAEYQG